jgi:hypothetical protein
VLAAAQFVMRCVPATYTRVCETWSLTLKEGHRLRVFENRVLRGIFGPKRDEVTGGLRNCMISSSILCILYWILLG